MKLVGVDEYLNCEMEMGKCNRKVIERIGKKIKRERREGKTERKENQMRKKGKGRRKGNKKQKGKGKKTKKGRSRKGK